MSYPKSLGMIARPLRRQAIGKFPALVSLLEHWPTVVGPETAQHCLPIRLVPQRGKDEDKKHATRFILHLQVRPSYAPVLQHDLPQLLNQVNGFLGEDCVTKITLHQAPPDPYQRPVLRPLSPSELQKIDEMTNTVTDSALKLALQGLGKALLQRKN